MKYQHTGGKMGIWTGGLVTGGNSMSQSVSGLVTSPQLSPTKNEQIWRGVRVVVLTTTTISGWNIKWLGRKFWGVNFIGSYPDVDSESVANWFSHNFEIHANAVQEAK